MRITVDEVRALYQKHNMKPAVGSINHHDGRCCPLGIIAIEHGFLERLGTANVFDVYDELYKLYNEKYVIYFYRGFDDFKGFSLCTEQGYLDGVACRKALL